MAPISVSEVTISLTSDEADEIILGLVWRAKQRTMGVEEQQFAADLAKRLDALFLQAGIYPNSIAQGLLDQKRFIDVSTK